MATGTNPKSMARLEARVSPETKALLQKAADLEGRTLTDFVAASSQAEAKRVIERTNSWMERCKALWGNPPRQVTLRKALLGKLPPEDFT